jgi:DNA-binding response OmpR family regulator
LTAPQLFFEEIDPLMTPWLSLRHSISPTLRHRQHAQTDYLHSVLIEANRLHHSNYPSFCGILNTILLVDDDLKLRLALSEHLSDAGYYVSTANSIGQMQTLLLHAIPDLLVLDIHLPDGNGFDACAELRSIQLHIPIIILTASAEDASRIKGLNCGADDYITKPFNPRELLARINAAIRRATLFSNTAESLLSKDIYYGFFRFISSSRSVMYNQRIVPLTNEELIIFVTLMKNPGQAVSRLTLSQGLVHQGQTVKPRNIDMLIYRLRQKISTTVREKPLIKTIRGKGYLLDHVQQEQRP